MMVRMFARANEDRKEHTHRSNSRTLPKETPKAEETSLESIHALMACLQRWEEQPDKPIEQEEVSARVNDIVVLFGQNDDASSDEKKPHQPPAASSCPSCLERFSSPDNCLGQVASLGLFGQVHFSS
jgi:hypothetical protein